MRKTILPAAVGLLLGLGMQAYGATITFSGTGPVTRINASDYRAGLDTLDYSLGSTSPGTTTYVPAAGSTPALAALYTPDASTTLYGTSPNQYTLEQDVFAQNPLPHATSFGTLSQVSMSFHIYSSSGGGGNLPYGELFVDLPDGNLAEILNMGGTQLNDSTAIHVVGTDQSYWGQSLASILNDTYEGQTYGSMPVDWVGVGIGNWDIPANTPASAEIDSITVSIAVPEGASTLFLLGLGFAGLAAFGVSQTRLQVAKR
jgi:hypothetical protein